MANFEQYYQNIYLPAEGQNYTPNDIRAGVGTKCGVSAELYTDATKKPMTEAQLQAASCDTLKPAVRWVWNKMGGDKINSQKIADIFIDHALNKGWVLMGFNIQYYLNFVWGAGLVEDGKVGPKTIGALNAAAAKDEAKVYAQLREYRRKFYLGITQWDDKPGRRYSEGYDYPAMGQKLIDTRLNRFFPDNGINPYNNTTTPTGVTPITPESDPLTQTEIATETAKTTLFNPKDWKDWVILTVAVGATGFLLWKLFGLIDNKTTPSVA
jgi:hypothetical protein